MTAVLVRAGQPTSAQSQQYNLALLHSLLAQAHSAGAPGSAVVPGPASQPARPYLPAMGTSQMGALAQGMIQGSRQPGLPMSGLPGQGLQPLQRPALTASPIPAPAARGGTAERSSPQLPATLLSMQQQSQHAGQSAGLEQGNVHGQQGK